MNRWILTLAAILMCSAARAADELPAMFIYAEPDLPGPMELALLADEVVAATPWVMAASTTALGSGIDIPVASALPPASPAVAVVPVAGGGAAVMVDPVAVKEQGFWATIKKNPGKSFFALAGIARIVYDNRVKLGLSSPDEAVGGAGGSTSTSTSADQQGDNDGVNIDISGNSGTVSVTIIKDSAGADVDAKQASGSQPRFESDNTSGGE